MLSNGNRLERPPCSYPKNGVKRPKTKIQRSPDAAYLSPVSQKTGGSQFSLRVDPGRGGFALLGHTAQRDQRNKRKTQSRVRRPRWVYQKVAGWKTQHQQYNRRDLNRCCARKKSKDPSPWRRPKKYGDGVWLSSAFQMNKKKKQKKNRPNHQLTHLESKTGRLVPKGSRKIVTLIAKTSRVSKTDIRGM